MGRLQTANPRFCFVLGFLLLGIFPSDLVTSISVDGNVDQRAGVGIPPYQYLSRSERVRQESLLTDVTPES
jgi:hypothetical protein